MASIAMLLDQLWSSSFGANIFYVSLICAVLLDLYREVTIGGIDRLSTSILLLRLLSVTHLIAFTSMYVQIEGLCGLEGLMPVSRSLREMKKVADATVFTFTDLTQSLSVLLTRLTIIMLEPAAKLNKNLRYFVMTSIIIASIGIWMPCSAIFGYLFISYYCLKRVTHQFTDLQWDILLLESSFSAILLSTAISINSKFLLHICNWLFKLLLFRLMFGSGYVKLTSGDPSWSPKGSFLAMSYHFLTQPLPNKIAPIIHKFPKLFLQIITFGTILFEVFLPLASWGSLNLLQEFTAAKYVFLMISIGLTGNFGFFNILTSVLSLSLCQSNNFRYLLNSENIKIDLSNLLASIFSRGIYFSKFIFDLPASIFSSTFNVSEYIFELRTSIFYNSYYFSEYIFENFIEIVGKGNFHIHISDSTLLLLMCLCWLITGSIIGTAYYIENKISLGMELLVSWYGFIFYSSDLTFFGVCGRSVYALQYWGVLLISVLIAISNINSLKILINRRRSPENRVGHFLPFFFDWIHKFLFPLFIGQHYGLFPIMTKIRKEIIIEVSDDMEVWYPVVYKFKPSLTNKFPIFVWPLFHMPRLDWRLWFIVFIKSNLLPKWFYTLLIGIMEGNLTILSLLHSDNIHLTKDGKNQLKLMKKMTAQIDKTSSQTTKNNKNDPVVSNKKSKDSVCEMNASVIDDGDIESESVWKYIRVSLYEYTYNNTNNGTNMNTNTTHTTHVESSTVPTDKSTDRTTRMDTTDTTKIHLSFFPLDQISKDENNTENERINKNGPGTTRIGTEDLGQINSIISKNEKNEKNKMEGKEFWNVKFLSLLIPPTNIDDLYHLKDICHISHLTAKNKNENHENNEENDENEDENNENDEKNGENDRNVESVGNVNSDFGREKPTPDTAAELISKNFEKAFLTSKNKKTK